MIKTFVHKKKLKEKKDVENDEKIRIDQRRVRSEQRKINKFFVMLFLNSFWIKNLQKVDHMKKTRSLIVVLTAVAVLSTKEHVLNLPEPPFWMPTAPPHCWKMKVWDDSYEKKEDRYIYSCSKKLQEKKTKNDQNVKTKIMKEMW